MKDGWRKFLTEGERAIIAEIEAARANWARLNKKRKTIIMRAQQREKRHDMKQMRQRYPNEWPTDR